MKKCPLFSICGGCAYDFSDEKKYKSEKLANLPKINFTDDAIWGAVGTRRRADFAFVEGHFGFFKTNFRGAVEKLPASIIRFTWNDKIVRQYAEPEIKFNDKIVKYTPGAFLQPTQQTEQILRDMVVKYVGNAKKTVDLFCGLGNFTYATNATGFDVFGNGIKRDLFKRPLTAKNLNQYEVIIMDPPRTGAMEQCKEIAKSNVPRVIYVSCNPNTFVRDAQILERGGYKMTTAIPIDQFVGASHWEIFSIFDNRSIL